MGIVCNCGSGVFNIHHRYLRWAYPQHLFNKYIEPTAQWLEDYDPQYQDKIIFLITVQQCPGA